MARKQQLFALRDRIQLPSHSLMKSKIKLKDKFATIFSIKRTKLIGNTRIIAKYLITLYNNSGQVIYGGGDKTVSSDRKE